MNWETIAQHIRDAVGESFTIERHDSVGGGCINQAWHIQGAAQDYFVKLNRAEQLAMFEAEAEGLRAMAEADAVRVPQAICTGTVDGQAFIVQEYLPMGGGGKGVMEQFGRELADMHRYTRNSFGWHRDNTIGSTPQPNDENPDWIDFWRERRLGFQLQLAARKGAGRGLLNKGERLMSDLDAFFDGYQPEASLLHGDLWSGNYGVTREGEPVIFDPAVYFGDREADLAMTELFGSFGDAFYAAYNEAWPLDAGYRVRKTFYNLYHILNHFNMFGGGYAGQAESMIDRLLGELRA